MVIQRLDIPTFLQTILLSLGGLRETMKICFAPKHNYSSKFHHNILVAFIFRPMKYWQQRAIDVLLYASSQKSIRECNLMCLPGLTSAQAQQLTNSGPLCHESVHVEVVSSSHLVVIMNTKSGLCLTEPVMSSSQVFRLNASLVPCSLQWHFEMIFGAVFYVKRVKYLGWTQPKLARDYYYPLNSKQICKCNFHYGNEERLISDL